MLFVFQLKIAESPDQIKHLLAFIVGMLLETSQFMYVWLLPLKIAKDITDRKLRSFQRLALDRSTHSFVGTVVGALVGTSLILDIVLFSNLMFLFQSMALNGFREDWQCVI
jgi:hypothetical protein